MVFLVIFFIELIILYFLSRKIFQILYALFYRITRNKNWTVYLLATLFLPGTFIHEISHVLAALFLLVPFSDVEFLPRVENNGIKMGSVGIGKVDPIRRFLIGVAPFIIGTFLVLLSLYLVSMNLPDHALPAGHVPSGDVAGKRQAGRFIDTWWGILVIGYVVFEVSNTMFASKKDLEGAIELFLFLLVMFGILYIAGIRIPYLNINEIFSSEVNNVLKIASIFLLVPVIIDSMIILLFKFLQK